MRLSSHLLFFRVVLGVLMASGGLSLFGQSAFYEQFERHDVLPPQWYSPAGVEAEQNAFYNWTYPRTEPFTSHYSDYGLFLRPENDGASGDEGVYESNVSSRMETEGVANLGPRQFFTDSRGTELPYFLLTPPDYDPNDTETTYPLLIVIHGQGGVGGSTPTGEAKFMALDENRELFPAFVLSPTFPGRPVEYAEDGDPNNELKTSIHFDSFMELVDELMANEQIDTERIYATGFSMGGATTWTILFERPDLLSAAAPFAGGPGGTDLTRSVTEAANFKDTAIWSGIGTHDFIGASWGSLGALNYRMMYDKVRQAGHGAIRHWEIPDLDHNSNIHQRRLLATVEWMFAHRKGQDIPAGFMHVPHDATAETNGSIRFEGYAFGRPEATHYEWTRDGVVISGEDGPVLELDNLTTADSGKYAVTAFYPDGSSITSPEGRLEVLPARAPNVVIEPEDTTAYTGEEVALSVEVEGTGPITYAWTHDGSPLTESADVVGVDTNALTLSNLTLASSGLYTLTATSTEGSDSVEVNLEVQNDPYYQTNDLRAWIPDATTLPVLRGILVNGNGAGANNMVAANNPLIQEWAFQHGFVVIGTSIGNLGEVAEWNTFVSQLSDLATQSGRPELENAPMLFWGHSMGGQSAYGAARGLPDRMIAFDVNKGSNYVREHGSDPWHIPALMIAGASDSDLRRNNIHDLFEEGRAEGAPWAWLEEFGEGHSLGNSMQIVFAFFDEILPLRYPEDPTNVPTATDAPTLTPVDQTTGWLVETGTDTWSVGGGSTVWNTGYLNIESQADVVGDPLTRGWVPTETTARLYRAVTSYVDDYDLRNDDGKHFIIDRPHDALMSFDGEVAATVRYAPSETLPFGFDLIGSPDWTEIRVYDGDQLIETITASAATRFDLELDLDHTRPSNWIHMEMDLSNGEKRTSHMIFAKSIDTQPLTFLREPRDSAALAGGTVRLAASVEGSGPIGYQWSKDGVDIGGATEPMLELSNLSAADEGDYLLTVSGPDGQTLLSDPVTVSVGDGDTFWQRINFQTANAPTPEGWLPDLGDLFGDRGNGETYGWTEAPHAMRQRFELENPAPSMMHDGLAVMRGAVWEMDVPNGLYRVRVVAGDPISTNQRQIFDLNGERVFNITTTPSEDVFENIPVTADDRWADGVITVPVWEGKLRLEPHELSPDAKVCFLEIDRVYQTVTDTEAVIAATPESGLLPLDVDFSTHRSWIKSGASIQSASWDFGDGSSTVTGETVTHTFTDPGDFTVTLTLTDSTGASSIATQQISVGIPVPVITTHPQGVTIPVGDPLDLSVVAEGYGTLDYEWVRSGQVVRGETSATVSVASSTTVDSGNYLVNVSNGGGTVPSETAVVTVVPVPPEPANVTASPQGSSQVRVSWDPVGDFMQSFTVERSASASGPWTVVGTTEAPTISFTDTALDPVTTYHYRVRAENQFWDGAFSASVDATTEPVPGAGWTYAMDITLDGYQGASTLENFPVLVRFDESQPGFTFSDFADAQGGDLRFVNAAGDRELAFEIDTWNDNGTAAVWVRLPSVSGTTTGIRALWGNPDATDAPDYTVNGFVWQGNYRAVWHLEEDAADRIDSTHFNHHANPIGPVATTAGVVGQAARFDGSTSGNTALALGDQLPDTLRFVKGFTLEGWMRVDAGAEYNHRLPFEAGNTYWNGAGYNVSFNKERMRTSIGTEYGVSKGDARKTSDAYLAGDSVPEEQWIHFASVWDGTTLVSYINGQAILTEPFDHEVDYTLEAFPTLLLGAGSDDDNNLDRSHDGDLDEMRISEGTFSADWVRAVYRNIAETDQFMTLGTPETTAPPPAIDQQPQGLNINVNESASFTVVASSDEPISYQWQKDGVSIGGATSATFTIANSGVSDSGFYRVAVTNVNGTSLSAEAELVVNGTVPTVSEWPTASNLEFGETLADSTLTGGSADTPGSFAFADPSITPEVGTGDQTVVFTPDDGFTYETVSGPVSVTVNPADATVTLSDLTVTYNGQAQSPTVTTDPAGLDVTITYDGGGTAPSAVGSYAVEVTVSDPAASGGASGTFTIDAAPLTVQADDAAKFEGDPDPALTWTITAGQLFAADSLSGNLSRDPGETVGSYTITQGTLAAPANYTLTFQSGLFSVLEASDAPWVLQSDFDGLNIGNLDGQDGWSGVNDSAAEVLADPADAANKIFKFAPNNNDGIDKGLSTSIQSGEVATIFFRFRVPDVDSRINQQIFRFPASSNEDNRSYSIRLKWDSDPSDPVLWTFDAGMGGSSKQQVDQAILRDTWYNFWVVIDNANGLYRLYIQGDAFETQTLVTSANLDDTNTDSHPFYPDLIENLAFKGWNNGPMLYDDFYLAHGGENLSNPVAVIPPGETFDTWINGHSEVDPAERGPLDTPAGDGIPNVLKYAFGLDPMDAQAGDKRASETEDGFPVLQRTRESTSGIALRYRRDTALTDLTFHPEWSAALGGTENWRRDFLQEHVLSTDNGVEWVEVRFTESVPPSQQFLRITVEY